MGSWLIGLGYGIEECSLGVGAERGPARGVEAVGRADEREARDLPEVLERLTAAVVSARAVARQRQH